MPCYLKTEELLNLTKSAIFSFQEAELPEYELIIIDDNSPIYGGYLRDTADTYIKHKDNKGFMKSVNDGLNIARGKYIAVANNDIRVAPNFYQVAKEIFEKDPEVYSVHPRMCFYDEPMVYGDKIFAKGHERWCQTSFFLTDGGRQRFPEHFAGTGGGYDDWFYWSSVRDMGFKTVYTTRTCFQHKDSSTTQVMGEQSKFGKENAELFKQKFGDYPEDYYNKLYPEQMMMPWREEFMKL